MAIIFANINQTNIGELLSKLKDQCTVGNEIDEIIEKNY